MFGKKPFFPTVYTSRDWAKKPMANISPTTANGKPGTIMMIRSLDQVFENKKYISLFKKFVSQSREIYPWEWTNIKSLMDPHVLKASQNEDMEVQRLLMGAIYIYEKVAELRQTPRGTHFRTPEYLICSIERNIRQWAKHVAFEYKKELREVLNLISTLKQNKAKRNETGLPDITMANTTFPLMNQDTQLFTATTVNTDQWHDYHENLLQVTSFLLTMVTPILNLQLESFIKFSNF